MLYVTIDSRQSAADRIRALAHEAGHILFGHYLMDEGVWTLLPPKGGDDQWEVEADYFSMFACRSIRVPAGWVIGGQIDLIRPPAARPRLRTPAERAQELRAAREASRSSMATG